MKTKQLQLVTFEQKERLKKLGFDWECEQVYSNGNAIIALPTVALALKWCRDEKGFDYSIIKGRLPFEYSYNFLNGTEGRLHINGYEKAESALLDEILTYLEK